MFIVLFFFKFHLYKNDFTNTLSNYLVWWVWFWNKKSVSAKRNTFSEVKNMLTLTWYVVYGYLRVVVINNIVIMKTFGHMPLPESRKLQSTISKLILCCVCLESNDTMAKKHSAISGSKMWTASLRTVFTET